MNNEISPEEFIKLYPNYEVLASLDQTLIAIRRDKQDVCWISVGIDINIIRFTITLKELQDITMLITYFYNKKEK
jgi:hypothetical protein